MELRFIFGLKLCTYDYWTIVLAKSLPPYDTLYCAKLIWEHWIPCCWLKCPLKILCQSFSIYTCVHIVINYTLFGKVLYKSYDPYNVSAITGSQGEKEEEEDDDIPSDRKLPKSTLLSKISANTIKSVLEVLCDESVSQSILLLLFSHFKSTCSILRYHIYKW